MPPPRTQLLIERLGCSLEKIRWSIPSGMKLSWYWRCPLTNKNEGGQVIYCFFFRRAFSLPTSHYIYASWDFPLFIPWILKEMPQPSLLWKSQQRALKSARNCKIESNIIFCHYVITDGISLYFVIFHLWCAFHLEAIRFSRFVIILSMGYLVRRQFANPTKLTAHQESWGSFDQSTWV